MFTGLVSEVGKIINIVSNQEGKIFTIHSRKIITEISLGDSVSVNGVCLTVTLIESSSFSVQAVHVTLQKTNLGKMMIDSPVNLELALRFSDRLGGHFVQGHVNGIALIRDIKKTGNNYEITIEMPEDLRHYLLQEGSIALDGISLTIAYVTDQGLVVSIIPHTYFATTLNTKKIGDSFNVEIDILAKYVELLTEKKASHKYLGISREWLAQQGY